MCKEASAKITSFLLLAMLLFTLSHSALCQIPNFSKVPNVWDNDSVSITYLIQHGIPVTKERVVCWFPPDSLSAKRMDEITDTVNRGIIAAEKLINAPLTWQVHTFNEPYTFYFRIDTFISHASLAGFVSVPFWRIKRGKAPWLHEAVHEMLNTNTGNWQDTTRVTEEEWKQKMPLWLFEGLPDHISLEVSRNNHLHWYDVFSYSSRMNIDSIFKENMKAGNDTIAYILSHIGAKGVMPELFSKERMKYAPAFYHGSCSFVQYIANTYGTGILLSAISSFKKEEETIEKLSGKSLAALKKNWLQKLQIED